MSKITLMELRESGYTCDVCGVRFPRILEMVDVFVCASCLREAIAGIEADDGNPAAPHPSRDSLLAKLEILRGPKHWRWVEYEKVRATVEEHFAGPAAPQPTVPGCPLPLRPPAGSS